MAVLQKIIEAIFQSIGEPFTHSKLMKELAKVLGRENAPRLMVFNLIFDGLLISLAALVVIGGVISGAFTAALQATRIFGVPVILCLIFVAVDHLWINPPGR